jgi:transposase
MVSASTLLKFILGVKDIVIDRWECTNTKTGTAVLHIWLHPMAKAKNRCPVCGRKCPVYDGSETMRSWRALDLNGTLVYLHAPSVRVCCPEHGVHVADVPWAFPGSRFTRSFDLSATRMAEELSKTATAEFMRIDWETVGRCISRAREYLEPDPRRRLDGLRAIGVDETSYRKGHKYITVVVNHDTNEVIWAHERHGKEVFEMFLKELTEEQRASIEIVTGDGARWIDECIKQYLPRCKRCVDGFHVVEWANEALDKVRRKSWRDAVEESRRVTKLAHEIHASCDDEAVIQKADKVAKFASDEAKSIKGSLYTLGKAPEHLTEKQKARLAEIALSDKKLYRAYILKEKLRLIIHMKDVEEARHALKRFFWSATHSRIKEFSELAYKIRRHEENILNTLAMRMSNARIEATNNKIKLIIRRSYGFRNIQNMIDMVLLICSNLRVPLPNRPETASQVR